jgi:hypothetical protein
MNLNRIDFSNYPLKLLNINPYYILGFMEGDGSFISKYSSIYLGQHKKKIIV